MRVLLTTDTVGGVWDYTCTLARSLERIGHDVLLAVLGEPGDRGTRLPARIEVAARRYRLEWMPDAGEDVAASTAWLVELSRLWAPDVVHLNQFSPALGEFEAPTVVVTHSDVLSWFSETLGAPAPDQWRLYEQRVADALARATVVVAPTRYQSRLLEKHYGRAADRVVPNGIIPPAHAPALGGQPLVVSAGRAWDSAKGMRTLDEAAGILGRNSPPVHLLGPCTSPYGQRLEAKHLVVHGAVDRDEVDAWLTRASVYVAPSIYEPFGLAPLEAALHGCALVLSDIAAFRELWDGCAEFFPAGDAERLAEILSSLPHDGARVQRHAEAARRRALQRYSAEGMCRNYQSIYSELAISWPHIRPVEQPV